jgi:hypothetical protein
MVLAIRSAQSFVASEGLSMWHWARLIQYHTGRQHEVLWRCIVREGPDVPRPQGEAVSVIIDGISGFSESVKFAAVPHAGGLVGEAASLTSVGKVEEVS